MPTPADSFRARDALDRLVTHRVRGFRDAGGVLYPEASREALRVALRRRVAVVEVDTRVTADGEILVYHDATLDTMTMADGPVAGYRLAERGPFEFAKPREAGARRTSREPSGFMVPTLDEFLREFAAADSHAVLQVDLKDPIGPNGEPGWLEQRHCRLLREHGLVERAWIISWYPEVLWRVFQIDPGLRLGFSHLPIPGWARPLTGPGRLLARPWLIRRLGALVRSRWPDLEGVEVYFDDEDPREERALRPGRYPLHVLTRLPRGRLARILRASRGGVGLTDFLLRRRYVRAARAAGLRTFVYTIEGTRRYLEAVRRAEPDMIFSDDASGLLDALDGSPRR